MVCLWLFLARKLKIIDTIWSFRVVALGNVEMLADDRIIMVDDVRFAMMITYFDAGVSCACARKRKKMNVCFRTRFSLFVPVNSVRV